MNSECPPICNENVQSSLEKYVLCKYMNEFVGKRLSIHINFAVKNMNDEDDTDEVIENIINKYAKNNKLHDIYSKLYDEVFPNITARNHPDFPKHSYELDSIKDNLPSIDMSNFASQPTLFNKSQHTNKQSNISKSINPSNYYNVNYDMMPFRSFKKYVTIQMIDIGH